MPRVSIIIPNYNHAAFLTQRIDSVLAQTFRDFEIIILDDYSTDQSRKIIESYRGDPRISIEFNSINSGCVFKQWNKGIQCAGGDYLWIAESDDYSSPEFLEKLVGVMERNPNVGVAFCDSFRVCGDEISPARERWFGEFARLYENDFTANGQEYVSSQMLFFNTIPNASSALFRRELALQLGGADESFLLSGDWLFWISMLGLSDIAYVATPLNYYRYHEQTARHANLTNGVMLEDALRISTFVLENFQVTADRAELVKERLTSWFIETMMKQRKHIPVSRQKRIRQLASQLNPDSKRRYWLRRSGIGYVMLGIQRRMKEWSSH
jgi:glycosyltransferase involved in cell wall biosynthesis